MENPFFEEFDINDVVNNYDEDAPAPEAKKHDQEKPFNSGDDLGFRDFLVLRNISGSKHSATGSTLIPGSLINETGKVIEIRDSAKGHDHDKDLSQRVIINRSDDGGILSIEFICSCGERTVLRFEEEED